MKYNRVLTILCAVAVAFITLFCSCVTAFAQNPFIPSFADFPFDDAIGCKPITVEEAQDAAYQIYGSATGIDKDNLNGMLIFVADTSYNAVSVYSIEYPDTVFDVIYYVDDTHVYSYVFNTSVTLSDKALTLKAINNGVDNGFIIMTKAFNFLIANTLCCFILGLSFTFFAFRLIRYGIRSARAM